MPEEAFVVETIRMWMILRRPRLDGSTMFLVPLDKSISSLVVIEIEHAALARDDG